MVIEWLSRIEAKGISLLKDGDSLRFEAPKGVLNDAIISDVKKHKNELLRLLSIDNDAPYNVLATPSTDVPPCFSLSPLQQAYWVGEKHFFQHSCKAYYYNEYRVSGLDIERLQQAVNYLVETHDALRMAIDDNGQQRLVSYKPLTVDVVDLRQLPVAEGLQRLEHYRYAIENALPPLDSGKPWLFTVHRLPEYDLFSFTFRLIAVDAVSFNLLIGELIKAYQGGTQQPGGEDKSAKYSYYDYIRFLDNRKDTPVYRQALNYWQRRIPALPAAPQLPLLENSEKAPGGLQVFERARGRLERKLWLRLRDNARQHGLTVNSVLCCVFADVVARWSSSHAFTLNVLVSDRPSDITGIDALVGNCSTTILLQVQQGANSFVSRAQKIRQQLYRDMEHSAVAGVELIRLLQQQLLQEQHGTGDQAPMPVVFTSGIDIPGAASDFTIHESDWSLNHTHLKTPQVWLDHQVYEDEGELVYNWDYIPAVFPQGLVATMFDYYEAYVRVLAESEQYWQTPFSAFALPPKQRITRDTFNSYKAPLPVKKLHEGFVEMAQQWPDRPALMTAEVTLSYGQLFQRAKSIALAIQRHLRNLSDMPAGLTIVDGSNQVIAVCCQKGADQIAAVMGVLMAGHTYLPIDIKTPPARVQYIVGHSGAVGIVSDDAGRDAIDKSIAPLNIGIDELGGNTVVDGQWEPAVTSGRSLQHERAYIIYTSGSTGNPKGVVINHQAAMNTIEDMVRRFGMAPEDRVLGLSALNFDLSVYDIFATLSHGAVLVLPPEMAVPDPAAWVGMLEAQQITVWNSVPALMDITLEHLRDEAASALTRVRLVLMSGDWIAPSLAKTLQQWPAMRVVALGGATEASIWSNYYDLKSVPEGWHSVPYGVPLTNQSMVVLDQHLQACPDWVVGDLFIGGEGLADEYLNDTEKTENSFIIHPQTQQRLYRTGDLARIREGLIEFIGRADFQVKVRGFRVELGEIEAQLSAIDHIEKAVVIMVGEGNSQQQLVGFYVSARQDEQLETEIKAHLSNTLPHYMVPSSLIRLDSIPLSSNAKIDRKKLLGLVVHSHTKTQAPTLPETETENVLLHLWQQLLPDAQFGVSDNFFEIGGNSLIAVRLTNEIADQFSIQLPLSAFFQYSTVRELADRLDVLIAGTSGVVLGASAPETSANSPLALLAPSSADKSLFLIHPVGGNVVCYQSLAVHLTGFQCYGIQAVKEADASDTPQDLDSMADYYSQLVERELEQQANGKTPVYLGGWSMGAVLTILVAEKLAARGYSLAPLLLIDPWVSDGTGINDYTETTAIRGFLTDLVGSKPLHGYPEHHSQRAGEEESTADYLNRCIEYLQGTSQQFASLNGIGRHQLLDLFSIYYRNALMLRKVSAPVLSDDYYLVQTNTDQRASFPGLMPIFCEDEHRKIMRADLSHWDVMQTAELIPIVEGWKKTLAIKS